MTTIYPSYDNSTDTCPMHISEYFTTRNVRTELCMFGHRLVETDARDGYICTVCEEEHVLPGLIKQCPNEIIQAYWIYMFTLFNDAVCIPSDKFADNGVVTFTTPPTDNTHVPDIPFGGVNTISNTLKGGNFG